MNIARVFPTKTSMSPDDQDSYFDIPGLFTPDYEEIHISVTFTWDIPKAEWLAKQWAHKGKVKIGGVAIDGESNLPFIAGMYLKKGISITSRGCPNRCRFCFIKQDLVEFDNFPVGNIIQDNNILACSDRHWQLVMTMLKTQKAIEFKGGLETRRLTLAKVSDLKSLRIKSLWFACDSRNRIEGLINASKLLKDFSRNKKYCYVLIGDDMKENEDRLVQVWKAGFMPFAQLERKKETHVYSQEWKNFQRKWSRPAIITSMMGSI
jgi:hypothetical protein